MELNNKFILDACCGGRMMWYNKKHPNTIYIDIRKEDKGFIAAAPHYQVNPDMLMDFRKMDFPDKCFKHIVFEPPHLSKLGKTSMYRKKYGCLNAETWPIDIKMGFDECWRVLDNYGLLVFKWSNSEIPFKSILKLAPTKPLYYNISNSKATSVTKWFIFMKIPKGKGEDLKQ